LGGNGIEKQSKKRLKGKDKYFSKIERKKNYHSSQEKEIGYLEFHVDYAQPVL
jgi:hypothetical protein